MAFAILGFAVLHAITHGMNSRVFLLAGAYASAIVFFWPVLAVAILGLAETAFNIRGRVAFSGAGWYRPDFRGKFLSLVMPRISRAYAFTRWSTDYTTSMFQDTVLAGGMTERCGYKNVDWHVQVRGSPMGDIKFAFVWMESDELIDDLRRFNALIQAEVDRRVRYRRA